MAQGKRLNLKQAQSVAKTIVRHLAPFCERIEVAGSIRREAPTIGDIELVLIPKAAVVQHSLFGGESVQGHTELDTFLESSVSDPMVPLYRTRADAFRVLGMKSWGLADTTRWGDRYKRLYFLWPDARAIIPVDLFYTTEDNWGNQYVIRTGPADFSKELMTRFRRRGEYVQRDGYLWKAGAGDRVSVPDEQTYFQFAGLPWLTPQMRSAAYLKAVEKVEGADDGKKA